MDGLYNLVRKQEKVAGFVREQDAYSFSLSPTCPPSTTIRFSGGYSWQVYSYLIEYGWHIPSYEVDITDPNKVSVRLGFAGYTHTFSHANWYAPCLFVVSNDLEPPTPPDTWPEEIDDYSVYLYGNVAGGTTPPYLVEYETSAQAEDACRQIIGHASAAYGMVCGGIILRNNGNTYAPNEYAPVDMVNRGRSYLFGKKRYGWMMG